MKRTEEIMEGSAGPRAFALGDRSTGLAGDPPPTPMPPPSISRGGPGYESEAAKEIAGSGKRRGEESLPQTSPAARTSVGLGRGSSGAEERNQGRFLEGVSAETADRPDAPCPPQLAAWFRAFLMKEASAIAAAAGHVASSPREFREDGAEQRQLGDFPLSPSPEQAVLPSSMARDVSPSSSGFSVRQGGSGGDRALRADFGGKGAVATNSRLELHQEASLRKVGRKRSLGVAEAHLDSISGHEELGYAAPAGKRTRKAKHVPAREDQISMVSSSGDEEGELISDRDPSESLGGELSSEEETPELPSSLRLFQMEDFPTILRKATRALGFTSTSETLPSTGSELPQGNSTYFPKAAPASLEVPFPADFMEVVKKEWDKPGASRPLPAAAKKCYDLPASVLEKLQIPLVDAPVSALISSAVYCRDGEESLKGPEDRRTDTMLRRAHEASSMAIRASAVTSFMARAMMLWARDLLSLVPTNEHKLIQGLNKLVKAAAFNADSSLDAMLFCSRSQAAAVAVRRQLWLKHWNVDDRSKQNLASAPFLGTKLFGDSLEPVLVEGKDKKKTLVPGKRREDRRPFRQARFPFRGSRTFSNQFSGSSAQSFQPSFQPSQHRESKFRPRWGDQKSQGKQSSQSFSRSQPQFFNRGQRKNQQS